MAAGGLIAQNNKPVVYVAVTDISCAGRTDGQLELTLQNGALPVAFQWTNLNTGAIGSGQLPAIQQPLLLTSLPAGIYRFSFADANGADTTMQRILLEPPPLQANFALLTNFGGYQLQCAGGTNAEVLLEMKGGTIPLSFLWSNGDRGIRADSLSAGPISVSITDARGCMLLADTVLKAPAPILTAVGVEGETCFGQNSGLISVQSVSGGVPPYQFSLNGDPPGNQMAWTDLPNGPYFLFVEDAIGCVHTDGIILPSGLEFTLNLGPDTSMLSGDTLHLTIQSDPPADTLIWQPATGVQMVSAAGVLLTPQLSTTYRVTAVNADGCVAEDEIRVTVNRDRDIYAPNVIKPLAQDAENRAFTLYGSAGIRTVSVLQVYDRFGRLWFERRNFPVNDTASGWTGADGADEAPSGVYLWRAILLFTDGRELRLMGDVTVLR